METLRHFFLEEARVLEASAGSDARALREFVEGWNWVCPGVFTGTDLSSYVQESRIRWELLLELLRRAGERVAKFGEFVPLDYLKANVSTPTACFTKVQQRDHTWIASIGSANSLGNMNQNPFSGRTREFVDE